MQNSLVPSQLQMQLHNSTNIPHVHTRKCPLAKHHFRNPFPSLRDRHLGIHLGVSNDLRKKNHHEIRHMLILNI